MNRSFLLSIMLLVSLLAKAQQGIITPALKQYFADYINPAYTTLDIHKIDSVKVDENLKMVHLYVNGTFAGQPFTLPLVDQIYNAVQPLLAPPYNTYQLTIYSTEKPIQTLVPMDLMPERDPLRAWGEHTYKGKPWITPESQPYKITRGLVGRHMNLCASHGRYYSIKRASWEWQRPNLYCTTEDMFTQTIMVPYLYPMLQNAGAIVYTPRERDWQKNEVVIDNDTPNLQGTYNEIQGKSSWEDAGIGFANLCQTLTDSISPFALGTSRMVKAQSSSRDVSSITWLPEIPQEGDYAVYVSYKSLPNSVTDAHYTVIHQGIATRFSINQTMGSGIWVYLGHFHFGAGQDADNCVILTNESDDSGVVTADAVRFGGGMSNIVRQDSLRTNPLTGSGMPRFLEGARYSAQWSGIPYWAYSIFQLNEDYNDDIRVRPAAGNYLSRGSITNPGDSGVYVPIDLHLSMHSDAGVTEDMSHIGSLGIYTTNFNDGLTGAGLSRVTSRDLCDMVLTQIYRDLSFHFGQWNRRAMWDRNYGETREAQVPAIILEILSHQNFSDMLRGHDPYFKFTLARAVYKSILRFEGAMYGVETVTQPLPVTDVAVHVNTDPAQIELSWMPQSDPLDASAEPDAFVVYTSINGQGYDNGTIVENSTQLQLPIEQGVFYRFRVSALNKGGCSFPSEEVCAYYGGVSTPHILIVNGFNRVAGPQVINTESECGFDMEQDPGVADVRTAGYCGNQICYSRSRLGKEPPNCTGFSGSELEGMVLAGNTHDFVTSHAHDILAGGQFTIASCSANALSRLPLEQYQMMDLILGAQRNDGYSSRIYKTFTPLLQQQLAQYAQTGHHLMISGSFVGSDMQSFEEKQFTSNTLKYIFGAVQHQNPETLVTGMGLTMNLYRFPNEQHYWIKNADVLQPVETAFPTLLYSDSQLPAAIAYPGQDYRTMVFGFPLECIQEDEVRRGLMNASIRFLLGQ